MPSYNKPKWCHIDADGINMCGPSESGTFQNSKQLAAHVKSWCANATAYDETTYGPIEKWHVSPVTDMS